MLKCAMADMVRGRGIGPRWSVLSKPIYSNQMWLLRLDPKTGWSRPSWKISAAVQFISIKGLLFFKQNTFPFYVEKINFLKMTFGDVITVTVLHMHILYNRKRGGWTPWLYGWWTKALLGQPCRSGIYL